MLRFVCLFSLSSFVVMRPPSSMHSLPSLRTAPAFAFCGSLLRGSLCLERGQTACRQKVIGVVIIVLTFRLVGSCHVNVKHEERRSSRGAPARHCSKGKLVEIKVTNISRYGIIYYYIFNLNYQFTLISANNICFLIFRGSDHLNFSHYYPRKTNDP